MNHISSDMSQHRHQLLALEASLSVAFRDRRLRAQDYDNRLKLLRMLHGEIERIEAMHSLLKAQSKSELDLGLPHLSQASVGEKSLCRRFAQHRQQLTLGWLPSIRKMALWAQQARDDRGGWIRTTLRLAKLRKLLRHLQAQWQDIDSQESSMVQGLRHLLQKRPGADLEIKPQEYLGRLSQIFEELQQLSRQIAQLKESVHQGEWEMTQKEAWLATEKQRIVQSIPVQVIPGMTLVRECTAALQNLQMDPVAELTERVDSALAFVCERLYQQDDELDTVQHFESPLASGAHIDRSAASSEHLRASASTPNPSAKKRLLQRIRAARSAKKEGGPDAQV